MKTTLDITAKADKKQTTDIYLLTTRKLLFDNRKAILYTTIVILGFWFGIGLIQGIFHSGGTEDSMNLYLIIAPLGCVAYVAMSFNDMKTKQGRTAMLMTPASTFQKFLPRLVNSILGPAILLAAGYVLMETGRMLSWLLIYQDMHGIQLPRLNTFGTDNTRTWCFLSSLLLMTLAIFFYGGILWPKNSFIKTGAVLVVAQNLFSIVLALTFKWLFTHDFEIVWKLTSGQTVWTITGIFIALTVLFYWLAYRRLRRCTVLTTIRQ